MKISFTHIPFFSVFVCSLFSCSSQDNTAVTEPVLQTMDYVFNSEELETMAVINTYRQSVGLNTLEPNKHVSYIAHEHNTYMINNHVVSHEGFDERYDNIIKVLEAIKVGENIAYNYKTPEGALEAWLLSPDHKKIIEGDYTHFGVSIRQDAANRKYYTNIFIKLITK